MKHDLTRSFPGKSCLSLFSRFSLVGIFIFFQLSVLAQQRTISGTVTGTDNAPLPGVSVMVKGTTLGTITGADGKFNLVIPESAGTMVFSFIGMETQEILIASSNVYNVILTESLVGLDEVIVIGYGTAKKSDLTGSVSRVDGESIKIQAPTQIVESLAGTISGLYSNQSTSAAGGASLEIRGPSSLSAGTDPLVVLDGVIYNGSLRDINPADIESMDIMKDASSAAVFGSKAASGVILITTTKGKPGKPTINFSSKLGIAGTTNDFKSHGPESYLDMRRDVLRMDHPNQPSYYFFNPDDLPNEINIEEWRNYNPNPAADNVDEWLTRIQLYPIEIVNYKAGRATDFYDLAVNTGIRQDYNLSATGATDDLSYYLSLGYLNNEGIIKGDEFSTIRARINLLLNITEWLKIGANTQFAFRDESVVQASLGGAINTSPYGSMWNEDGSLRYYPHDYTINPFMDHYNQERLRNITTLFSNLFADIALPFGLSYRISFQPNFAFTKDFNYWPNNTVTGGQTYTGGYGQRDESSSYEWMLDNLLKWNKQFGAHSFDLTLLANAELTKNWYSRQYNSNFSPNENLIFNALQFGNSPGLLNSDLRSSGDALMARLNYTLSDKYLFTGTIRRDGYSAFGQLNPRATFPALAFAWQIHEENFYNISWMNRLKLRLSWGVNGNRDIGAYSALATLGSVLEYDGQNVEVGVYNTSLANPNLRWERTEALNIGFDIGLFENRIDLSIDGYDSTTDDLLLSRQLPAITGFSNIMANLGKLGNRGLEITLSTINYRSQQIDWRSNLVFSINRNKIKELWGDFGEYTLLNETQQGELPDFTNLWFPGEARDVVWDYDIRGIWQLGEETEASVYNLRPGNIKAVDINNDGKYTQLEDKRFIGHTAPRYRIGLRNEVNFLKNFNVLLFIRADLGHLRNMSVLTSGKSTIDKINIYNYPYWSPENPTNEFNMLEPRVAESIWYGGGISWYKPTGFVRVQDLTLTYNLPLNISQQMKLKSLRLLCNIRNFITFSKWPGFDPESGMTPMPKVFTLGIDISL